MSDLAVNSATLERLQAENEQLRQEIERLQSIAYFDSLTGVLSRFAFHERLRAEWNDAIREKVSISILFLDLNDLGTVNNTKGHIAGDELLKQFSTVVRSVTLRPDDLLGRWGGDEFLIALSDATVFGANRVANRIRQELVQAGISCAIGVAASIPGKDDNFEDLIQAASKAMKQNKIAMKAKA